MADNSRHSRVALVNMPWGMITEPCLGLSLLKSKLDAAGVAARVHYANVWLLRWLRFDTYEQLADVWALNDFLFSGSIDPHLDEAQLETLASIAAEMRESEPYWRQAFASRAALMDHLLRIRREAIPVYLAECSQRILADGPTMVGFTCLFDQTMPSVALARLLKQAAPNMQVVLGGYALAGETGPHLLASFPWIDAVHQGDGEDAIVPLASATATGKRWFSVPGLLRRDVGGPPASTIRMDESPVPDFDDYFRELRELHLDHRVEVRNVALPVEMSRGCWWGQKSHCVFCGIDEQTLQYRQRSPENAIHILEALRERYGDRVFRLVDYILPHTYRRELLPSLAVHDAPFKLTCEMKANASREDMELMRDAGFLEVQPGIESFDTAVLKSMGKGVSAMQNIALLKSAAQLGLKVHYNLLYGFPDDEEASYERQSRLLPALLHLEAPNAHMNVLTTRFAPLQATPELFGLPREQHAHYRYSVLFSEEALRTTGFDAARYCYYFENAYRNSPALYRWYRVLDYQAQAWIDRQSSGAPARLTLDPSTRRVFDSRLEPQGCTIALDEMQTALLVHADRHPQVTAKVGEALKCCDEEVEAAMTQLRTHRLVYEEGRRYLGLPTMEVRRFTADAGSRHS